MRFLARRLKGLEKVLDTSYELMLLEENTYMNVPEKCILCTRKNS